jgi:hypothetical protein
MSRQGGKEFHSVQAETFRGLPFFKIDKPRKPGKNFRGAFKKRIRRAAGGIFLCGKKGFVTQVRILA